MEEVVKEYVKTHSCVRCGYCCSKCPCSYGKLDDEGNCAYLMIEDEDLGTYQCLIYWEIKEKEKNSKYPMFDCGCSSSLFNDVRNAVIEKCKGMKKCV